MRARKTKTEIRREQIAKSAMTLISRSGLKSVNVARVASEIGVVPSGIYRHFQSKDQILDHVLDLIAERLLDNVQAVREESPEALTRLEALLLRHANLVRNEVPIPRVIFSEELFSGHNERRRRVYEIFQEYLQHIAQIVREGQSAGSIRPELAPDTLAMMCLGLVQPAAILWVMSEGEFDILTHTRQAWDTFVQLLRVNKPAKKSK